MTVRPGKRFEIFKRDGFVCMYCGKRPPEALLEVDHIVPRCAGGSDDDVNLLTSCFECNRGKGAKQLGDERPAVAINRSEDIKERALQAQAYADAVEESQQAESRILDMLNEKWCFALDGWIEKDDDTGRSSWMLPNGFSFPPNATLRTFVKRLPLDSIIDAIDITAGSTCPPSAKVRYFCAVCWRRIKDGDPWS